MRRQGVTVSKRSCSILQIATIVDRSAPRQIFVSNYASFNVIDELRRIPGVGDANTFGAKDYSIRVWMRPDRVAQSASRPRTSPPRSASRTRSSPPAGSARRRPATALAFTYSVTTLGRLATGPEFGNIILRTTNDGGCG